MVAPPRPPPDVCRVVVIDDFEADYVIARKFLERAGYEVHWARSFESGLTKIAEGDAAAYLVDYGLGARSGVELIEEARQRGSTAPLVLLTRMGSVEVDTAAARVGATCHGAYTR